MLYVLTIDQIYFLCMHDEYGVCFNNLPSGGEAWEVMVSNND